MRIQNPTTERKTITQILKTIKNSKSPKISHPQMQSIRQIITEASTPKYLFEIVGLYHHMAINEDKKAFLALDGLLFPVRAIIEAPKIKNVTLKLAYLRLHCLLKYQQPYAQWIQTTRELLHHTSLSSTDIRSMLALTFYSFIKLDDGLLELYAEFLEYFHDELNHIDIISLMVFRKFFSKEKIKTKQSQRIKQTIE